MTLKFDGVKSPYEICKKIPIIIKAEKSLIKRLLRYKIFYNLDKKMTLDKKETIFRDMYLSPLYSKERTEAEGIVYSSLASRKKTLGEICSLAYVLGYTKQMRLKLIKMEILLQFFIRGGFCQ